MEASHQPRLLLTSVMRPIGPAYGDAESVGYELLHAQVTRAQGMFSPRAVHRQFSLDYMAENLENPTVVLHYPSRRELIKELKKGYDYVGISFIMVTYHRMKELSALVRKYSPASRIVLGGFGTVLPDEALKPWGDHICRGEGVTFMRELLGQAPLKEHKHPFIESRLQVFSKTVSYTGMIFAGLGCPNGCDFCSTSHFFKRQHLRLLNTGAQVYEVVRRHLDVNPDAQFTILDEEFLLNRDRAMEFRDLVMKSGKPLAIFVFASLKALSLYTPEELLEMGVDGVWIGYEGERSGYEKRANSRSPEEIIRGLKENGITVLASMIVGFDYQTPEIIKAEHRHLMSLKPDLCQFMIYNPNPGTPLYEKVKAQGLFRKEFSENPEHYWKWASGFRSLTEHPHMSGPDIERMQRWCFDADFRELGPTIYRVADTMLAGYLRHKDSANPFLRLRAERFARELRNTYPMYLPGELFAPTLRTRAMVHRLKKRVYSVFGQPSLSQRMLKYGAVAAALWTSFKLRFNLLQNPQLTRKGWRLPPEPFTKEWLEVQLQRHNVPQRLQVLVEEYEGRRNQLKVRLEGALDRCQGEKLAEELRAYLKETKGKLVLDFEKLKVTEKEAAAAFAQRLAEYRSRVHIAMPKGAPAHAAQLMFLAEVFKQGT
ncbi:MAG: B12-binding domain-containing radical SAM protein [Elusimicrobiales bacterium]